MAVGVFMLYNSGVRYILQGNVALSSCASIYMMPLHNGYTPSTAGHSALAQIADYQASADSTVVAERALQTLNCTASGNVAIKFDCADISGFSQGGNIFACKYLAVYAKSSSAGTIDNLLIGFVDTNVGVTTGIEAVQLNLVIPAGGLFKANCNA